MHQGKLKVNRHNPSRASVLVQSARGAAAGGGTATELRIVGRQSMNRALEGDVVVVRVLPRAEWSVGGGRVGGRNASGPRGKDKAPDEEDELAQPDRLGGVRIAPEMAADADEPRSGGDARPCAAVVGVVKRERRTYPCVLDPDSAIGSQHLAEPLDARVPKINITTRQVRPSPAWQRRSRVDTDGGHREARPRLHALHPVPPPCSRHPFPPRHACGHPLHTTRSPAHALSQRPRASQAEMLANKIIFMRTR